MVVTIDGAFTRENDPLEIINRIEPGRRTKSEDIKIRKDDILLIGKLPPKMRYRRV
jgi:hypothetical protein